MNSLLPQAQLERIISTGDVSQLLEDMQERPFMYTRANRIDVLRQTMAVAVAKGHPVVH